MDTCTDPINRTKVELKRTYPKLDAAAWCTINRTKVELKPGTKEVALTALITINRTKVELKRRNIPPRSEPRIFYQSYQSGIETA